MSTPLRSYAAAPPHPFPRISGCCGALNTAVISLAKQRPRPIHKTVSNKLCGRPPQYAPAPCKMTFDLLTSKVVSESHVTWATSVPILVFLGLSVLDLGRCARHTDRRQIDVRRASSLNAPTLGAGA